MNDKERVRHEQNLLNKKVTLTHFKKLPATTWLNGIYSTRKTTSNN